MSTFCAIQNVNVIINTIKVKGATTVMAVARGALPADKHAPLKNAPCYGAAKDVDVTTLRRVADACRAARLLEDASRTSTSSGFAYVALALTPQGATWLDDDASTLDAPCASTLSSKRARNRKKEKRKCASYYL